MNLLAENVGEAPAPITESSPMKFLTLWEPWATLAAILMVKVHETRRWSTTYRGILLIHAAQTWGKRQRTAWEEMTRVLDAQGIKMPESPLLGKVIGLCTLAECLPMKDHDRPLFPDEAKPVNDLDRFCGDWSEGRFGLRLEGMRTIPDPIDWPGGQGRPRNAPKILVREVVAQLDAAVALPAIARADDSPPVKAPRKRPARPKKGT